MLAAIQVADRRAVPGQFVLAQNDGGPSIEAIRPPHPFLEIAAETELYAEAGLSAETPLRVRILFDTGASHRKIARALASMWRSVLGVETELIGEEWTSYLQSRRKPRGTQVTRSAWVGDYADPNTFLEIFHTDHNQNVGGYSNPRYDQLMSRAASETDAERRFELLRDAERVLLEDYAIIPIYFYVSKHLVKPHVEGFVPNIMDHAYSRHYRLAIPRGGR